MSENKENNTFKVNFDIDMDPCVICEYDYNKDSCLQCEYYLYYVESKDFINKLYNLIQEENERK